MNHLNLFKNIQLQLQNTMLVYWLLQNFSQVSCKVSFVKSVKDGDPNKVTVLWLGIAVPQTLQIFSLLQVTLFKTDDLMTINVRVAKPSPAVNSTWWYTSVIIICYRQAWHYWLRSLFDLIQYPGLDCVGLNRVLVVTLIISLFLNCF